MHVEELGGARAVAMAERQELGTPAADMYPRKILEYMEGFLISKVIHTLTFMGNTQGCISPARCVKSYGTAEFPQLSLRLTELTAFLILV